MYQFNIYFSKSSDCFKIAEGNNVTLAERIIFNILGIENKFATKEDAVKALNKMVEIAYFDLLEESVF